ncbi:MAG: universal stress protein [Deltaproteobacteria bacterium]|nr:universal stress protein [Deltaproteobacteria bacterium]
MKHFENVIICLDDTARDEPMMAYMVPFLKNARTRQVTLLHVHDPEDDPHTTAVIAHSDAMILVPVTPNADMTERTRDGMHALAQKYLRPIDGLDWQIVLSSEPDVSEILSQAAGRDADLVVIGRHYGDARYQVGRAVTARRITEKSTCSVLVLPESISPGIRSILVPVRNSDCSETALRIANGIAVAFDARLTALNVFRTNVRKSDTRKAHMDDLIQAAQTENQLLIRRAGLLGSPLHSRCLPCSNNDVSSVILLEMTHTQCDLVAIGARGRTGAAGILLGAVTEELILQSKVPVLAIRKKGECVDLLHALLSLLKKRKDT